MNHAKFLHACKENALCMHVQESLAKHCSFKTGGNAQYLYAPPRVENLVTILKLAHSHAIPITILGEGTNVLPPDEMLPHLVIVMTRIRGIRMNKDENTACIMAGESVRHVSAYLARYGKSALEFLYGMPGTIGGALWMNARCYGTEISNVLLRTRGYTMQGDEWEYEYNKDDFAYKRSPFQTTSCVITECEISLCNEDAHELWRTMLDHEMDRRYKGHYSAPCAGSVFKNNYAHGKPAGRILDELGCKSLRVGGATVSTRHANIIITHSTAQSRDVFELSEGMKRQAYDTLSITLEREIVLLGNEKLWKKEEKIQKNFSPCKENL